MGGTLLRDWFQSNGSVLSEVHVDVHSPNEIRIYTHEEAVSQKSFG
ncbi:hypothetical protein K227x_24190 [Rubripirellula lacrimiformis]|uniref:Uncharacterized protein n=1 Tax=Rubripirellula lacrimiformis TaxID=1930273 RepID=A0A517NA74_9BACT|nr:hypothetical protein K227x_24190 [Rubripirellula lacrimiformis]